jgi:hypothetical protein
MNEVRGKTNGVGRKERIGILLCKLILSVSVVACIAFVLAVPHPVYARVFNIPSGDVTNLINAINKANANGRDNTINLSAGTYTLTSADNGNEFGFNGLPSITGNITIRGAGADTTIIDTIEPVEFIFGFRIFYVADTGSLTLEELTVRGGGGQLSGGNILNNGGTLTIIKSAITNGSAQVTGGIANFGKATITNSTIADNSGHTNGGIENSGTLNITNTVITNNESEFGSAGISNDGGTLSITNSTIANNGNSVTENDGGGILNSLGGTVTVTNSTIAANSVCAGLESRGGGIKNNSGSVEIQNTILALNSLCSSMTADCSGTVTSLGNNIIGDTTDCTVSVQTSDLTGDPGLDAFTDNGTPGNGHFPLIPNSRAIDAGNNNVCLSNPILATDQIGQPRIGICDIGAIEFQQQVNDKVSFEPIGSTFSTTSDTTGCPSGFVGKFSFSATLTDRSTSPPLSDIIILVNRLTNGNLLQNTDGGPGGVGATLTPPSTSLSPGGSEDIPFVICLKQRGSFSFFVDVLGTVNGNAVSTDAKAPHSGPFKFKFSPKTGKDLK